MILKLGDIDCEEYTFERFITEGVLTCQQLRYLHFTSKKFHDHKIIKAVNEDSIEEYFKGKRDYIGHYDNIKAIHVNEYSKRNGTEIKKLPKVITSSEIYSPMFDNENLLTLFDDIILARSLNDSKKEYESLPVKHGEDLLEFLLKDTKNMSHFECMIFTFEQIFDPDMILDRYQLSAFHLFAMYENMKAMEY